MATPTPQRHVTGPAAAAELVDTVDVPDTITLDAAADPLADEDGEHTDVSALPRPPSVRLTRESAAIEPPQRDSTLDAGMLLNEYRVLDVIGEGGMGVVYSAMHPVIGKRAAIKILRSELCRDAGQIERFIDEARVVNAIGHPNIVDVFAFGTMPDGRCYFVMEWLKGETLRARMDRGALSPLEACTVMKPLCRALEAAHDKGIIHRDIKPDNVFLVALRDEQPLVKLLDFGIAKLHDVDHRVEHTATGAMVGTPQYMAPEQARGLAIDHRVDTYALGGMLFEMLTGEPPFSGVNVLEVVAKHMFEARVRASALQPALPAALDQLVYDMLAKEASDRPTLAAVREVLEDVLDSGRLDIAEKRARARAATPVPGALSGALTLQTAAAVAPPMQLPPSPGPSRRRGVLALAALGVVAVAAAVIAAVSVSGGGGPVPRPAAAPIEVRVAAPAGAPRAPEPPAPAAAAPGVMDVAPAPAPAPAPMTKASPARPVAKPASKPSAHPVARVAAEPVVRPAPLPAPAQKPPPLDEAPPARAVPTNDELIAPRGK